MSQPLETFYSVQNLGSNRLETAQKYSTFLNIIVLYFILLSTGLYFNKTHLFLGC